MVDQPPPAPAPAGSAPVAPEPPVYASRPPSAGERILRDKFYESLANQNKLMDDLGRQMLTVELAVPGVYAAILALRRGQDATLAGGWPLALTFGGWFLALALTFLAIFPRHYRVDTSLLRADAPGEMGIEDYFGRPARRKWWLLAAAGLAFWLGIGAAVWLLV